MRLKGYSDFSVSRAGVKSDAFRGAYFRLDQNVRDLFPLINATVENAKYHDGPEHIGFEFCGALCTLYPVEVIAAPFENESHAREFADKLVKFLNRLDEQKASVIPEYRRYRIVSPVDIYKLLPKTNCRECGFLSCVAFAAALGRGLIEPGRCPGFAAPLYNQTVYPVFDREGNLRSTFSIETPPVKSRHSQRKSDPDRNMQTGLTGREIQVLRLVAEGQTNVEISKALDISPHTVKSHVIHIFNKLNVNDRTQAAVLAARSEII